MNIEGLISQYSPIGDMITFIICVVILFIIATTLYFARDRKFGYLKKSLHFILVGAVTNMCFFYVVKYQSSAIWAVYVLRDIYHICFLICLYCFLSYLREMLNVERQHFYAVSILTKVLLVAAIVFDVLSPITKFGFCIADGEWTDPVVNPFNIFYFYSVISMLIMLLAFSNRLIKSVRICLIATELVIAMIMGYQAHLNVNTFSSFTYILPILVVMILLHSRPFDDKTGSMGVSSFESYIKQMVRKSKSVDYMVLKLNFGTLDEMPIELGKILSSFWHRNFRHAVLFRLEHDLFLLAIPRKVQNNNSEEKIKEVIEQKLNSYYTKFQIAYKLIGLFDINFIENTTDIIGIIKYLLINMEENSTQLIDSEKREELKLLKIIKESLSDIEKQNNLEDERVLAYCQPIRNMKTGKYDTAEALMRLSLPEKGFIMPAMFISLAEQYGHIHALTRIMLNKICKQIKELEEEGYDFKRISINFAASEIVAEDFCDEILEMISQYDIDPSKIGIELTETQNEKDFMIVKSKMEILKNAGMTIYLDDVGTGYSNLDRIVRYDVDVVKFDRFFILEAEKDNKIVKMMRHLSEAFRDLNYTLLYEGVETEENEELCMQCGADYIQGFKYSEPVPVEELRDFFEKN